MRNNNQNMKQLGKHHFIPRFLIKGFVNNNGNVWVYDKRYDQIKKDSVGPGGIFYEWGRNNLEKDGTSSSIIEDEWFKYLDNFCKTAVINFQEMPNTESLHDLENVSKMQYFLLHLYWRLPKTDYAFEYLINKANLNLNNDILEQNLKKDSNFKKVERLKIPNLIIKELHDYNLPKGYYSKLIDMGKDVFLLGDYPMLYKTEPTSFEDLVSKDFIFPISSKRIYSISQNNQLQFDWAQATTLNTLIIHQSQRFVCSPNKDFLEKSISFYKTQLTMLPLLYLKEKIFNEKN
jgi:hypothetical protein